MIIPQTKTINARNNNLIDLSQFGPINLVVIQPTSFCNLNCDYCYLPHRQQQNRLSLDLIDPIFKTIFTSPFCTSDFSICWHAGEPLAVPISFYESAFEKISQASCQYNQNEVYFDISFQTNGTLITQAWCDLFKQYPVHVGVSLDGPDFLHNLHRKTRNEKDSYELTMRGLRYLQKNEISNSIIAVITKDSLDYPDEMFNFFIENSITDVGFNMEETEGINQTSSLDSQGLTQKYKAFIQRFWQLIAESKVEFRLREFEFIGSMIYTGDRMINTEMNQAFRIVNIDYQGNFSTFDPELLSIKTEPYGDFILGNVLTDTLDSVCYTKKFQKINQDMTEGVNLCRQTCEYFGLCGGGAGSNKYWENGTFNSADTNACNYRIKVITDVVVEALESSLGLE
ncbi:Radical SAM domain protein [Rippkaea orientalis PCC 8801]|uniref:Radical SAM domain protein n=1 Tax=Rippkaea orientalis (strain PCC 8801 / RF-1) TaxID=41431 RepID=B7JUI0_RIPO1|nr:cyclophane-forming radical SAM/SPASM peptide maturase GrrM/OscB [Rippkaea orientalis]ACK65524.1 Radical SAM domain protein [Rippkaea orientalis PCC 8801]